MHLPEPQVRRLFAVTSALLRYPDALLIEQLPAITAAVADMPRPIVAGVEQTVQWLGSRSLLDAQSHYVELFDRKRRACLYLSYFLNGDTRRRGMALVEFKDLYRGAGWEPTGEELPDFLPTVLEFCAIGDVEQGATALAAHRSGIEVLRQALADAGSAYQGVVAALLEVVDADDASEERFLQLVQAGPPTETVGLNPFIPVEALGIGAHR